VSLIELLPDSDAVIPASNRTGAALSRLKVSAVWAFVVVVPAWTSAPGIAGAQAILSPSQTFTKFQALVPMRDGVRLNTEIYLPRQASEPLPILITRTPYGINHDARGFPPALASSYRELAHDGYIFVWQDIRGRFRSEGQFVMLRRPRDRTDPRAIDESTDTYDTIDWLLKQLPQSNGRVGVLGISYGGWLTVMATLESHPALKAVSPQASPADMFLGDDFHHNGAFRLSYGFEYAALMETSKTNTSFHFDKYDTFEWYLDLGPLANVNRKYFHNNLPTWNDFVKHPNYDAFWKKQAFAPHLDKVTVPTLNVAGWWDQEDFYGAVRIYELLERHDKANQNYLVVGPWNHGGWASGDGQKLGPVDFGTATSKFFRERVQAPWFAYFLKDRGQLDLPEALTFQTGSNRWVRHDQWPPRQTTVDRPLYFQAGGRLAFDRPPITGPDPFDSYVSDPARPVPYRPRPIEPTYPGPAWPVWLLQDQRFVHLRPDVVTWETEPLKEDLIISGDIVAHLFASTTGTDSDWVVKLIDVYPEDHSKQPKMSGYQLMVADEVLRGRFRKSFERPEPIVPGEINEFVIDLHTNDHCFHEGHRIMVQVQSSWFPVIDRNPQKFVANIFEAKESDYQPATQHIYRSGRYPSHVILPVSRE
jgi:putative CocE/NonD family hydrolase